MLRLKVFCLIFGSNLSYKLQLTYGDFPGNIYTCVFAINPIVIGYLLITWCYINKMYPARDIAVIIDFPKVLRGLLSFR